MTRSHLYFGLCSLAFVMTILVHFTPIEFAESKMDKVQPNRALLSIDDLETGPCYPDPCERGVCKGKL